MITKYDNTNNFIALSQDMEFLASLSCDQADLYSVKMFLKTAGAYYRKKNLDTLHLDFYSTMIEADDNPFTRNTSFNRCEFCLDEDCLIFPPDSKIKIENCTGRLVINCSNELNIEIYNSNDLVIELWHSSATINMQPCELTNRFRAIELKNSTIDGNFECDMLFASVSIIKAKVKADELKIRNSSVDWSKVEGKIIR